MLVFQRYHPAHLVSQIDAGCWTIACSPWFLHYSSFILAWGSSPSHHRSWHLHQLHPAQVAWGCSVGILGYTIMWSTANTHQVRSGTLKTVFWGLFSLCCTVSQGTCMLISIVSLHQCSVRMLETDFATLCRWAVKQQADLQIPQTLCQPILSNPAKKNAG